MNKQQSNQMSSLKKKLLAAIAMLLVACIMTVSSTYAWFTLSTAPEVKGISTTVGANGNLEMALGYVEYNEDGTVKINTFTGSREEDDPASVPGTSYDKTGDWAASNITWGNLVDLSGASYGLSNIELYPTRLNVTATAAGEGQYTITLPRANPLMFPKYGADGRISELSGSTMLGQYATASNGFQTLAGGNMPYGVSAIGTASTMSERQYAMRNYKAAVGTSKNAAKAAAMGAIREYAGTLAALAINEGNDLTAEQAAALNGIISRLEVSAANISDSLIAAVNAAWTQMATDETTWKNVLNGATAENKANINAYISYITGDGKLASVPTEINAYLTQYNAIVSALGTAKSGMTAAATDSVYTWTEVEPVIRALLSSTGIKIGTPSKKYTIEEIKADRNATTAGTEGNGAIETLTSNFTTIEFEFGAGSGIFASIADFTGDYSANINFPSGATIEGIPLTAMNGRPVKVIADTTKAGVVYLETVNTYVQGLQAPGNTEGAAQVLTDTYGYMVDLLFRTNASDSYLQLQTDAVNRVYEDKTDANLATMGGGSNMTFTMDNANKADVDALAAGIRVVFFDNSGAILGVATLNTAAGTETAAGYKVPLQLSDYEFVPVMNNGQVAGAQLQINGALADNTDTDHDEAVALCPLAANTKTGVSALVYLDGDEIDNADAVLADLRAVLNLQFSSSADLVPMDNNDLKNQVKE